MGKNRALYLLLLFLSFLFPYFYGGMIPYLIFHIFLVLPAVSLVHVILVYSRFKFVQEFERNHIVKGDKVGFTVIFANEDFFPYPYLNAVFSGENTIFKNQVVNRKFSLMPYSLKTFDFELECRYRGIYEIGLEMLVITDFLGLFSLKYRPGRLKKVIVYPRIITLYRLGMRPGYLSDSQSLLDTRREDMTMISSIRRYAYGDVFKKIHWKLTAKTGTLMVKDFKNTAQTSVSLILDLKKGSYSPNINTAVEDKAVECTVSITNYCLSKWIPVRLVYCGSRVVEKHAANPLQFKDIYDELAVIDFDGNICVDDLLKLYLEANSESSNMFVITSNISYPLVDTLYTAQASGNDVSVINISAYENDIVDEIIRFLPRINIRSSVLGIEDDIADVLENI